MRPDEREVVLEDLTERTKYDLTIYGITEEYLNENRCSDTSQLPRKLKPSNWLPNRSIQFTTSGYEQSNDLVIHQATMESIKLEWKLPKVYGSTKFVRQTLRWRLEHSGSDRTMALDLNDTKATIPGLLPSGSYRISLDRWFDCKINLKDDNVEGSRKEQLTSSSETVKIPFHVPETLEKPEIYLTGYTTNTIYVTWNKPEMFVITDHPETLNETLRIRHCLLEYIIDVNGSKKLINKNRHRYTFTELQPSQECYVQLITKTQVQIESKDSTVNKTKRKILLRIFLFS